MKNRLSSLVAVAWWIGCAPVAAQEMPRREEPFYASAHASAGVRVTRLRAENAIMVGGEANLRVTPNLSAGASGWALLNPITITNTTLGSDLALDVAYGGLLLERDVGSSGPNHWGVRLLLGGGNAKVSLPVVSTEIAADNFGVIEPEVITRASLLPSLEVRAHLGYRLVFGVEDLPQVTAGHLRGVSGSLSFSVGPF